jgi:hypothetical protein
MPRCAIGCTGVTRVTRGVARNTLRTPRARHAADSSREKIAETRLNSSSALHWAFGPTFAQGQDVPISSNRCCWCRSGMVMPRSKKARTRLPPPSPPAPPSVDVAGANMSDTMTSPLATDSSYFADRLKELRRLVGKQLCLSCAVGCTDAAVSFWESGKRLPQQDTMSRILDALAQGGASDSELSTLRHSWKRARAHLRQPFRDDPPPSSR